MITQEKQRKILLRTSGALGLQPLKVLRLKFFCGYNIQNKLKFCELIFLNLKVEEVIQDKVVDEVKDLIQDSSEESLEEEEQHITSRERNFKNSV